MTPWLRYLVAVVVGCHGFICIPYGLFVPGTFKEWRGSSRLLGSALTRDRLRVLVSALHVTAGIATLACAFAIGFAPSFPGWWRPLAIVGGAAGIAGFVAFWDGQTRYLAVEGVIGAAISLTLLVSAIAFPR
jgi:hypothetical protein